jgi:ketosteroid isomerase-like protein
MFPSLIAILAASCTPKKNGLNEKDIEAIQNLDSSYVALSEKNDWEQLALLFTPDVVLFPPNDSAIAGQSTNLNRLKKFGTLHIEYSHTPTDINGYGEIAYLQGNYQIKIDFPDNTQPFSEKGKYLWVLKKQSGKSWKIHRIIWNTSEQLSTGK